MKAINLHFLAALKRGAAGNARRVPLLFVTL
jgi:hypothetical protein